MRAGRVVQAGPPAEVWARPADPWTAAFLGFAPAVPARFTSGGVETPWGVLPVDGLRVDTSGDGPVLVVLRPDAFRLDPAGRREGKVVRCSFAGDHADLDVDVGGPPIRLRAPYRAAPAVGDIVSLEVEPDGVLVYPAG
jgi:iron(III) transport system ATP-binding protein